jgi:hypothetical protein
LKLDLELYQVLQLWREQQLLITLQATHLK